jgi:hypothetical protein
VKQLGIEVLGIAVSVVVVFVLSHLTVRLLAALMKGITTSYTQDSAAATTGASVQL